MMSGDRYSAARGAVILLVLLLAVPVAAEDRQFSGTIDTTFRAAQGTDYGEGGTMSAGFEEFANLRLKAPAGERGTIFAAVNLAAASGTALPLVPAEADGYSVSAPFTAGKGYASAMELERLYLRIEGEDMDAEAGLMRMAFGFGQAWRPMDFLNPPNPLFPDARPRGSLGGLVTAYPTDLWIVRLFYVTGDDPLKTDGAGAIGGTSAEFHGQAASAQALYALQAPGLGLSRPVHRFGLSLKVEAEAGFVLDALYTLDGDAAASGRWYDRPWNGLQGLQAAVGADYSFLKGKLIAVVQYLYNGGGALEPGDGLDRLYDPAGGDWRNVPPDERSFRTDIPIGELNRRNYLFGSLTCRYDDYTRAILSCIGGLDDGSFVPIFSVEHEPFQGLLVSVSVRVPLDGRTLGAGSNGELGPAHTGARGEITVKARLRF
jgi:hypothetical protein